MSTELVRLKPEHEQRHWAHFNYMWTWCVGSSFLFVCGVKCIWRSRCAIWPQICRFIEATTQALKRDFNGEITWMNEWMMLNGCCSVSGQFSILIWRPNFEPTQIHRNEIRKRSTKSIENFIELGHFSSHLFALKVHRFNRFRSIQKYALMNLYATA